MKTKPIRLVTSAAIAVLLLASAGVAARRGEPKVLREGIVLESVDGTLIGPDANDTWHFELNADANSVEGTIAAGTRFELLPSVRLETLIADVNDRLDSTYRLTATVTRFKRQNFLFPSYYLPLSKLKSDEAEPNRPAVPEEMQGAERSGAELAIPPDVLEKLQGRAAPAVRRGTPTDPNTAAQRKKLGRVMVNWVGVITASNHRPVFLPYGFGWNVGEVYYKLLPCKTLEQVLQRQEAANEPIRFNIVGLVTEFKGKKYLLLQRAIRVYSHGNFSP
ncbi:MAG: hypothetical protein JW741_24065 [Sedimentisphaerales bacterium]|nr:hypothetical protein [Sedimentisphaerales bacterium]